MPGTRVGRGVMDESSDDLGQDLLVATPDPRRLLDHVASGNRAAFEGFYHCYGPRVMAMVRRHVAVPALAEELVQEVFVAVWLGARNYRSEMGDPEQWLVGITRHKLQDHWRRLRGILRTLHAQAGPMRVGAPMPDSDLRLTVEEALSHLPAAHRQLVDLIYQDGFTFREAARALGVPVGTVKSRVHGALLALRAFFERSERA